MNNEERVKLVFETISKIAGFEIEPYKEFYMNVNDMKRVYQISEELNLYHKMPNGYFGLSGYNISPIFSGGYQLEEIKEPLLAFEEKEFLRYLKFDELAISTLLYVHIYNKSKVIAAIHLNNINLRFDGLKVNKRYSREELGL